MLLHEIPEIAAHHAPNKTAVRFGERIMSFAELRDDTFRLANALSAIGPRGSRVAILSQNCPEFVVAYYGVPTAGMILTTVNTRLSPREIAYILQNSEPMAILVSSEFLPVIEELLPQVPSLAHVIVLEGGEAGHPGFADFIADAPATPPAVLPDEDDGAWLLYTSGTTGLPKGAVLSHRSLLASMRTTAITYDYRRDETPVYMFPMFHIAGYNIGVYHLRGYSVVLLAAFDAIEFMEAVQNHRATICAIAPTMLSIMLDHPQANDFDLSSLRQMVYGASAMPPELLRRAFARLPEVGFGTSFGMTELAGNVTYFNRDDHFHALEHDHSRLVSAGRQMPCAMVRIVDDADRDCGVDQPGEILVKGHQVLKEYWRNPEATEKSFLDGWFRTGDIGRWDEDGNLYIVDRKKDMILSGGENVYSREVEDILYEHESVAEAAVIGIPDVKWGERVAAVIRVRDGYEADAGAIDQHCRDSIAGYKRPRQIYFVAEIPKNASGKILKHRLRDAAVAGELD